MSNENIKVFYHSADLDGQCSGAILNLRFPGCDLIPINFGQEVPWDKIDKDSIVYMVDFCLQPFDDMEKLDDMCKHFIWIDHHETAIEEAQSRGFNPEGIRQDGTGACALVWKWAFSQHKLPRPIRLLAEYDVWDHTDPLTLPFQYGIKLYDTTPQNTEFWNGVIKDPGAVDIIIDKGQVVLRYVEQINTRLCQSYGFETSISHDGRKYIAVCMNIGGSNSQLFDSIYNPEVHDIMITFCRLKPPANKWTVSLYSTKEDVECGVIAKSFGGGGHKGAAGFQREELPFKY